MSDHDASGGLEARMDKIEGILEQCRQDIEEQADLLARLAESIEAEVELITGRLNAINSNRDPEAPCRREVTRDEL